MNDPWRLTDAEWRETGPLLTNPARGKSSGRPRIEDNRAIAEACLYRHYHAGSSRYRTFGWNQLPDEFGVSPSTANRRFREWSADGSWHRFWHALLFIRGEPINPESKGGSANAKKTAKKKDSTEHRYRRLKPEPWAVDRSLDRFPVSDLLAEIERAYLFFNAYFFGKKLPPDIAISLERSRGKNCRGYFCARVWSDGSHQLDHIGLHVSVFGNGPNPVIEVLLHEMVHLRNSQCGISDCHPRNQYHNRYFRDLADLAGLSCGERDLGHGYAITKLNEAGLEAVAAFQPREDIFRWQAQ